MANITGIAGSLRKASFNAGLLRAAGELAPEGCSVDIVSIRGIPLYDADLEEAGGVPAVVADIQNRIAESDGLILATPEYNSSIPGVFKNAIDWLSRPPEEIPRVFGNRPVALMGATPGNFGTAFSQTAWLPVLRRLGMRPWFGNQYLAGAALDHFDGSGNLTDPKMRRRLAEYLKGFVEFIDHHER